MPLTSKSNISPNIVHLWVFYEKNSLWSHKFRRHSVKQTKKLMFLYAGLIGASNVLIGFVYSGEKHGI